jgi:hypothetical protein
MLIRGCVALLCCLLASPAWAAIVCSDPVEFATTSTTDPETVSYTTPVGANFLKVGVTIRHSTVTISGATHAGNAMTAVTTAAFTNPIRTQQFYIVNPTTGTNDVVVQFSAGPLTDAIVITACSGVDTADPIRAFNSATGTSTAPTVTVADVVAGDVVLDMFGTDIAASDPTEGANQTVLHKGNVLNELGYGSSQQAGADGGVMSWTTALSEDWAIQAVAIKPAAAASILQSPPLPVFLFE